MHWWTLKNRANFNHYSILILLLSFKDIHYFSTHYKAKPMKHWNSREQLRSPLWKRLLCSQNIQFPPSKIFQAGYWHATNDSCLITKRHSQTLKWVGIIILTVKSNGISIKKRNVVKTMVGNTGHGMRRPWCLIFRPSLDQNSSSDPPLATNQDHLQDHHDGYFLD